MSRAEVEGLTPGELRRVITDGRWSESTEGLAPGRLQANIVVIPEEDALDFARFCLANPKPCPVLEITEAGAPILRRVAPGADLRSALPRYRVFVDGALIEEPADVTDHWEEDAVGFVLGCSVTFESALLREGVPLRHLEEGRKVSSYLSDIKCEPAGRFEGCLVVSMRPIPAPLVVKAVEITARYPHSHGAPVHISDPATIGITDLQNVLWGAPPVMRPGDVPVFWAGGSTPQMALAAARPRYAITHKPGHMLVCDLTAELAVP